MAEEAEFVAFEYLIAEPEASEPNNGDGAIRADGVASALALSFLTARHEAHGGQVTHTCVFVRFLAAIKLRPRGWCGACVQP
ncbi:MAG: hypothetical protein VX834_01105 [Myxococcota bacterium]|nr:hypothetical protein [Myxococcota bacterium]